MPNPITTIILDDQPNAIEDLLYLIERDELPVKILGKEKLTVKITLEKVSASESVKSQIK